MRFSFRLLPAAALVTSVLLSSRPSSTLDMPLPGPGPRAALVPVEGVGVPNDERCTQCHAEIAAEWRQSLHHRAWDNEYFQHARAVEPLSFCRKCHTPLVGSSAEPSPEEGHVGIGCTACHVVPAGIVGTHNIVRRDGGHEVIGDARLGTDAACGGCHEFAFPGSRRPDVDRMQKTLTEHAQSAHAAKPCQDCHMPRVPSKKGAAHRSHDFRVQGNKDMMVRAVVVDKAEIKDDSLHIDMRPGTIGHAFPTGDLYRRVEVRVFAVDAKDKPLGQPAVEILRRIFGPAHEAPHKTVPIEREDRRLTGPRQIVLPLPKGTSRAKYEIVWQRMPPEMARKFGMKMSDHEMIAVEGIVKR